MLILAPVVLLAGAGNPPCQTPAPNALSTPAGGPAPGGMYARPLKLKAGSWYQVGATEYGRPSDPTSSDTGSIGGAQGYLPAHPDTFAELSVLDSNPANSGTFTFADANALNNLPYMTGLLVAAGGATAASPACDGLAATGTLQLTPGQRARILPDGSAAAPQGAPRAVKLAIAAANEIHTKPYPSPDVHYGPLTQLWPAYDCSGSASYVLFRAGLHSSAADGPGRSRAGGRPGPGGGSPCTPTPGTRG